MNQCIIALFLLWILSHEAFSGDDSKFNFSKEGLWRQAKVAVTWARQVKQGYNMRLWISNQGAVGRLAFDDANPPDGIGLEYPVGSQIEHLYGAGVWIGGVIDVGQPGSPSRIRAVTEGSSWNGALKEMFPEQKDSARDRIWRTSAADSLREPNRRRYDDDQDGKVDEDELDGFDNDGDWVLATDDVGIDGLPDSLETGCKGGYDRNVNPDPAFDNYEPTVLDKCRPDPQGSFPRKSDKSKYTEKNGISDHGEPHVDEDYAAVSDNDLYCSYTDTFRVPTIAEHLPLGIKIWQKSYAWLGSYADGFLAFDYYIINVGRKVIEDVYLGFFADTDVGPIVISDHYAYNFAGYYPEYRMAFAHNALHRGSTPIGVTLLGTPKSLDSLDYVFQWNLLAQVPTTDSLCYGWLNGEAFSSQRIKPNGSSISTNDIFEFFAFGPFDAIAPGDTLKISFAFIGGEGIEDGPSNLVENVQKAIKFYSRGYVRPVIPPSPGLKITHGFKKVTLEWGRHIGGIDPMQVWDDSNKIAEADPARSSNPPLGRTRGGRIFEGYRLYRSEDPADFPNPKNFTLLKQFDMKGNNFEYNVGIDSLFADSNLVRGKRYWYSVTSFGIPDIAIIEIPESNGVRRDTLYSENTESSLLENATKVDLLFSTSDRLSEVLVVPNPYRVDQDYTFESGGWEGRAPFWTENERRIKFIHLPRGKWIIRIFSLVGDIITTMENNEGGLFISGQRVDPMVNLERGEVEWDILSESNRALASGIYIYTVESALGKQIGKFVLVR